MKITTTAVLLLSSCAALAQPAPCSSSMAAARAQFPTLAGLPDDSLVRVLQEVHYPSATPDQVAAALCVKLQPPHQARELGAIDRWRYNSCQKDAAQAPTSQGVVIGVRLCREKFDQ